jgi:hypothetical protein
VGWRVSSHVGYPLVAVVRRVFQRRRGVRGATALRAPVNSRRDGACERTQYNVRSRFTPYMAYRFENSVHTV